jgi:3-isopropylmalate/(R)-2-methylmalate dehydratase small subunit
MHKDTNLCSLCSSVISNKKDGPMSKIILKLGDDVSTDLIYPPLHGHRLARGDAAARLCRSAGQPALAGRGNLSGQLVVGGKNFGCGSSREQAASCLKGWGLRLVASSYARIFLQNAVNLGLEIVICPELQAEQGDELEIAGGVVINLTTGQRFAITPLPSACQAIIDAGGLIPYTRQLLVSD